MVSQSPATFFGRLLAAHQDVQQTEYWLETRKYTIGRIPELCAIVINRTTVSRVHAEIEGRGSHFILRDLLSSNGTYVDGTRIEGEHILRHGQKIGFSDKDALLIFEDIGPTTVSPQTTPVAATPPLDGLHFNEALMTFFLKNQPLQLTPLEFRFLLHLYRNKGKVCDREELAKATWQHEYASDMAADNLDKVLFHLRKEMRRIEVDSTPLGFTSYQVKKGIRQ